MLCICLYEIIRSDLALILCEMRCTLSEFLLQLDPILQYHFEFLEDEVVSESVSPWSPLVEVILMGCELLHRAIGVYAVPAIKQCFTNSAAAK